MTLAMIRVLLLFLLFPAEKDAILTWYSLPGNNTACGTIFHDEDMTVAAPWSMGLSCGDELVLCLEDRCVTATVSDAMPESSAARYGGQALDATPAVMQALGVPFGHTSEGVAYGRAQVTWTKKREPLAGGSLSRFQNAATLCPR